MDSHLGFGFADSLPMADLRLCDDDRFWDSSDLWCRHVDDGGTDHQIPMPGQDNVFHARVRNRGVVIARRFLVTFSVKPYIGMAVASPSDWLPCVTAVSGFDLGPGEARVVTARWPRALVPPPDTVSGWLATVLGSEVRVAQRNRTVVVAEPDCWVSVPFVVPARVKRPPVVVELRRPARVPGLEAVLVRRASWLAFAAGETAQLRVASWSAHSTYGLGLRVPVGVTGEFTVDLVLRETGAKGQVLGGVAVVVRPLPPAVS